SSVKLWDARSGKERRTLVGEEKGTQALAFSPDGRLLAVGNSNDGVGIWGVASGEVESQLRGDHAGAAVAFTPDGNLVAGTGPQGTVGLGDADTGRQLRDPGAPTRAGVDSVRAAAAFPPDGKRLATAGNDLAVHLWDVTSGKELVRLQGH